MANNDDKQSRPGKEGKPGTDGANRWDVGPVGKQSLVDKEFGSPVKPGTFVQRREAALSRVDAEFGFPVRFERLVQQRAAVGPDAHVAPNEVGVHAADAQGVAAPASSRLDASIQRVLDLDDRMLVQRAAARQPAEDTATVHAAAAQGIATPASTLPYAGSIQRLFGLHDVSSVQAHTGPEAAASARAMGASAYATGNHIVLGGATDLHTVAHEAAHVVQQQGGVQLKGGVGAEGDAYERHADAVADRVVAGQSAVPLLDQMSGGGHSGAAVQRAPAMPSSGAGTADPEIAPPMAGIDKPGFIDNSEGSNIRTGPAEAGGKTVRDQPLPPATRVFVSGTHPSAPEWWYVTAYLDGTMVRGYVQHGRVNTDLPEPTAKLHQVVSGDTAEKLAAREYGSSVRDGHDLRYYENVLLYVNQQHHHAAGITGTYQDPGLLGGGGNNVQLVAGHRIWLISPAYAKALEGVVPSGSLTGGAVAKVKRFAGHIEDILRSVTESRHHFGEVAGEYAQAIRDHLPAIAGIVAGFLLAEVSSALLAATPTGVGQIVAVVIQLALTAFGAAGMAMAVVEALNHGSQWLTLAWTAKGDDKQIAAASIEFLKMLVSVAMAALSYLGVKGNYGNAVKIAHSMPTGALPAFSAVGGGQVGGAGAGTGVLIGPSTASAGIAGNAMMQADDSNGGGGNGNGTKSTDPAKELEEIKQKLESDDLTGKQKQALRARKQELQVQLGKTTVPEDVPTPERSSGHNEPLDNSDLELSDRGGKTIGKGSKVDLDALRDRPAQELISGSLKKSPSYAAELAEQTVGELLELQKAGGLAGVKAGKMLKLIKDAERLRGKVK
jgi:hypothetical protein